MEECTVLHAVREDMSSSGLADGPVLCKSMHWKLISFYIISGWQGIILD